MSRSEHPQRLLPQLPKRRRRVLRVALVVVATVLALLLAEGGLRVWGAVTKGRGVGEFLRYDGRIGWSNQPGFSGRHRTAEFDVAVHIDANGCRVAEIGSPALPFDGAVLMLGDSTTFGWGVEEPQTVAAHLRRRLSVPVHNLGVSGIASDQQLLRLRGVLASSRPRLVIVTFTPNDVYEVTQSQPYRRHKPYFELRGDDLELRGSPPQRSWWIEHSHLWRSASKLTGRFRPTQASAEQRAIGEPLVCRLYLQMQRECAASGCAFLLVGHHAPWLRRWAEAERVGFLDVTATFDRLEAHGPIRIPNDGHWLPHLHEAIADDLMPAVESLGITRR